MISLADVITVVGAELVLLAVFIISTFFFVRSFKGKLWKLILIIAAVLIGLVLMKRAKKP